MRVFVKQGKFWLEYYDKFLKKPQQKPTGIHADRPFVKGEPLWWKKSKHHKELQAQIDRQTAVNIGAIADPKPLRALSMERLMELAVKEAELNRDEELSKGTRDAMRDALRFYERHTKVLPRDLTTEHVRALREAGKEYLAPVSVRNYFSKLSRVMKFGVKSGLLRVNPFEGVRVKVAQTIPKEIPVDVMLSHLEMLPPKALGHAVLQILIAGRVNETCSARRIQDEGEIFQYWNSKKRRWEPWPVTPALRFALDNLLGKDYLCHYRSKNTLIGLIAKADGRLTSHDYKRFAVQQAEEQNPPRKILDAIAHHAPVENVMIRKHYSKDRIKQMRHYLILSQQPILDWLLRLYSD